MAAESKIEKYLVAEVKKRGGEIRKVKWIGRNGAPDRLPWIPTWTIGVFVELKRPGKMLDGHQVRECRRLEAMGFKVFVIDTFEKVDKLMGMRF